MKHLILALIIATAPSAFARQSSTEDEVLRDLVLNASKIKLVDENDKLLPADQQLVELIATHLAYQAQPASAGNIVLIGSVSVNCDDVTPPGLVGSQQLKCQISFMNSDYELLENGNLDGPKAESAYIIEVEASRAVTPSAKARISTRRARTTLAG